MIDFIVSGLLLFYFRMRFRSVRTSVQIWRQFGTAAREAPVSKWDVSKRSTYLYVGASRRFPASVEPNLDFRQRLSDLDALRRLLEQRGYDVDRDFGDLQLLKDKYDEWFDAASNFWTLYSAREAIDILKDPRTDENAKCSELFNGLVQLEDCVWTCLRLPADLHPWTPVGDEAERLATFVGGQRSEREPSTVSVRNHMDLLQPKNQMRPLVEFKGDPPQCFVFGAAARLLKALESYFVQSLSDAGYRSLSPMHFVRSAMLEAHLGESFEDRSTPSSSSLSIASVVGDKGQESSWALNLAGHRPSAYLALFSRKGLGRKNAFPLRFFSHGMAYGGDNVISRQILERPSLVNFPTQRFRVTSWTMFENESDLQIARDVQSTIQALLSKLGLSFIAEQQPSYKLLMSEMSRVDISVPTDSSTTPVPLASICNYGDFLSRRARIMPYLDISGDQYVKCCYAEIDLYNILARIYEELCPLTINGNDQIDWWPSDLISLDSKN